MAKTIASPSEQNSQNNLENSNNDFERTTDFRAWKYLRKNVAFVSICALTLVIVILIITIILLVNRQYVPLSINIVSEDTNIQQNQSAVTHAASLYQHPSPTTVIDRTNLTLPSQFKIVSRLEWMAQPPIDPPDPLDVPVPYVIIHHTATENCSSQAQCILHVRLIQSFHMESRNWWDIGFNFLIGGDGAAYEGRGWKAQGAHTQAYNAKSIGIAFIGTFNNFKPPQRQITACKLLIEKGVELGYIKKDYKLLAARQLQTTQSPGAALYEEIKIWDHWSRSP